MTADFYVGDRLVHPSLNRIVRDGHEIRVEPKAMHVLCVLAEHSGRVVGRDELMEAVWSGTFVTDDALKRCVSDLRKALGDSTRNPAFIETIAKGGYRLIAQVSAADGVPTAMSGRRHVRMWIAAAALLLC